MGIPLICNSDVGDTDEIVKKENVGIVINKFQENEYSKAVEEFEKVLNIPKQHLREIAQKHFSLEMGVKSYSKIYEALTS